MQGGDAPAGNLPLGLFQGQPASSLGLFLPSCSSPAISLLSLCDPPEVLPPIPGPSRAGMLDIH